MQHSQTLDRTVFARSDPTRRSILETVDLVIGRRVDHALQAQLGGIPADVASRLKCTSPTLPTFELPPEGQEFFSTYADKYGEKSPDPYALYGYEAMRLALDAIQRSATGEKADILKALFDTKDRQSVLGTYSIDDNGDTTLTDLALETVKKGKSKFDKVVKGAAP